MNKSVIKILTITEAINYKDTTKKCVFISGITGQDGSHMVDYLLKNTDLIIFGGVRSITNDNIINIIHINSNRFHLINFNLLDTNNIYQIMEKLSPDYFINFAAQSFVSNSWEFAKMTWDTNCTSIIDILEAIKKFKPSCRLYQAGSSEEFGNVIYSPQDEAHPLNPCSPYGASKVASRQLIKVYRESYNLYVIQGWLFNHEGRRRGEKFVTRKITKGVANIFNAINNNENITPIELGNIYAKRDWSDAEDFIDGIWRMLNQDIYNSNYSGVPIEYILSSDETHSIKEFIELSFKYININGYWKNDTTNVKNENFYYKNNNLEEIMLVTTNPEHYRQIEKNISYGNSQKIRNELDWVPKIKFIDLVNKMMINDINILMSNERNCV